MYGTNSDNDQQREYRNLLREKSQPLKKDDRWKELANSYHKMRMVRAKAQNHLLGSFDECNYLLMGLAAACGKVMTQTKRIFGNDADRNQLKFSDTLASVRIYVEQLAVENSIDLDQACNRHMEDVLSRMDK